MLNLFKKRLKTYKKCIHFDYKHINSHWVDDGFLGGECFRKVTDSFVIDSIYRARDKVIEEYGENNFELLEFNLKGDSFDDTKNKSITVMGTNEACEMFFTTFLKYVDGWLEGIQISKERK